MFRRPQTQPNGRIVVVTFGLAMAVYLTMLLGPLAWLEQIAGLRPFDMRPGGYSPEQARDLLAALGPEGQHLYLWRQIPLDCLYPALFAVSVAGAIRWFSNDFGSPISRWFRALSVSAYIASASDYMENFLIIGMLNAAPDPSPSLVRLASAATLTKSAMTTVALTALLVAMILFVAQKVKHPDQRGRR